MKKWLYAILPIVLIVSVPILLRRSAESTPADADQLVIVSPHNESIQFEFEQAFRKYYREKTGREVAIDWRSLGGASDIVRYLNSAYTGVFRHHWTTELGKDWSDEVSSQFLNKRIPAEKSVARKTFLEMKAGVGIDLFFGGGQYDFQNEAAMGILVPCGFRQRHPELFSGKNPVLVAGGGGEVWYDQQDRYYGCCFSSFGICMNLERMAALKIPVENIASWRDLADPRLRNAVALADPTMSGSINKCFEMMIQRQMQDTMAALAQKVAEKKMTRQDALDCAWEDAFLLLKEIGGNARYLTFSASRVPVDCASGQIAAGMCIDFYGRSQSLWEETHVGRETVRYFTPDAGSAVSCDPIGILRGAPHRERAEMFLDFVMSKEGQRIWNRKTGVLGGPQKYALHRLSVRQDLYTPEERAWMTAPEASPFDLAHSFTYQGAWTGPYFGLIRNLLRVMLIDCHTELLEAWHGILEAGGPDACPQAMAEFRKMPFSHREAREQAARLSSAKEFTAAKREWAEFFRKQYKATLEKLP